LPALPSCSVPCWPVRSRKNFCFRKNMAGWLQHESADYPLPAPLCPQPLDLCNRCAGPCCRSPSRSPTRSQATG
jgi:hypothetical protein